MDPMDEMMGLGGLIQPAVPADAGTKSGGSWTDFLADPIARASLLSFGLQAMTGGWGNGTQQMAQALGAGAQGGAATAKAIQEQEINNRDFQAKQHEGEANRAQSEKNARIAADSRAEVANIRGDYRMQLAAATAKPQNSQEMNIFQKQFQSSLGILRKEGQSNPLSPAYKKSDAEIQELAKQEALMAVDEARKASGVRSQGAPLPGDSATGDAATQATAPGSAPTGAPGKAPNATSGKTAQPATWEELKAMPGFAEKIANPAWREELLKNRPDLSTKVNLWDREQMARDARKRIWGSE